MQLYYSWRIKRGNDRLSLALQSYYDRDMDDMLVWMRRSVNILSLIALFVPFLIFSSGVLLVAYARSSSSASTTSCSASSATA